MKCYTFKQEGENAFKENIPFSLNPYSKYTIEWKEWNEGWINSKKSETNIKLKIEK